MLLRMEACPLMSPLRYVAMRETHMIVQTHLIKLHILHFAAFMSSANTLWWTNLKCSSPLSFIQYPIMPLKVCKPSSLNFLHDTTWHVGGLSSHLKQTLIFLFNTGRQVKFPFTAIWKCSWVNAPPSLRTEHKPSIQCYFEVIFERTCLGTPLCSMKLCAKIAPTCMSKSLYL